MFRIISRPFIINFILCLVLGCSLFLCKDIKIIGMVQLSDNPPGGHGGVLVFTDAKSTITAPDGYFELRGSITMEDLYIEFHFEKQGYKPKVCSVFIHKNFTDSVVNIGKVVLERIPSNFFDDFNDGNADGWIEDSLAIYGIENGEYSIESPNDNYQHWALHLFGPDGNFIFEVETKFSSGDKNSPYGIGVFDSSNTRTCLFITKSGYYKVSYYDNSWRDIRDWSFSPAIDTTSNSWNKLKMIKNGNTLDIYINNSKMGSFSSSSIRKVRTVGLYVQDNLHIHFDNVKAEGN